MLILNQREVRELLPMTECIGLMRTAFQLHARGETVFPLRPVMKLPDKRGVLATMPAYVANPEALAIKVIAVFPDNLDTLYDAHQGAVLLFDPANGRLVAMMDASEVTAIRTAAATAVATDLLANQVTASLAILGSGVQAGTHLEAIRAVRPVSRVYVWSRTRQRAQAFVKRCADPSRFEMTVTASAEEAVRSADIVCTTTGAHEPVLHGRWLAEGAHVNAVGSASPAARELDTAAIRVARLFVDCRESALNEAGDFIIPKRDGAVTDDDIIGEIGELLIGKMQGRIDEHDITLFKSLGIAVQDAVVAEYLYRRATEAGVGTEVELGGMRVTIDE